MPTMAATVSSAGPNGSHPPVFIIFGLFLLKMINIVMFYSDICCFPMCIEEFDWRFIEKIDGTGEVNACVYEKNDP